MSEWALAFEGLVVGEVQFADDVCLDKFYEACMQLQPLCEELGFALQWSELRDHLAMLEASTAAGLTVGECLDLEAEVHTLEGVGSAAKFADRSPATGLMWSARILAFIAELLDQSGRCAERSFRAAAPKAFERHIGTSFGTSASERSAESATRKLFTAGMPSEQDEEELLQKLGGGGGGGVELARHDMIGCAAAMVPLAEAIRASFKRRRMDDSKKRAPS